MAQRRQCSSDWVTGVASNCEHRRVVEKGPSNKTENYKNRDCPPQGEGQFPNGYGSGYFRLRINVGIRSFLL